MDEVTHAAPSPSPQLHSVSITPAAFNQDPLLLAEGRKRLFLFVLSSLPGCWIATCLVFLAAFDWSAEQESNCFSSELEPAEPTERRK